MDGCAAVNAWIRHCTVAKAVDGRTYRRADADGQICHRGIAEAENGRMYCPGSRGCLDVPPQMGDLPPCHHEVADGRMYCRDATDGGICHLVVEESMDGWIYCRPTADGWIYHRIITDAKDGRGRRRRGECCGVDARVWLWIGQGQGKGVAVWWVRTRANKR